MALEEIVRLLNARIGLNPNSIGTSSIERAVSHRIAKRNCINISEYSKLLAHDAKEVRELIEEVVVPETWFFRNKGPFEAFKIHVKNELLPKCNKRKPIRMLSVPCATGEEPYSMAIALLDADIDPHVFRIDAIDVSKKSIELAKDAHYGKNSFRDVDPGLQQKYFVQTERGWLLNDTVKKLIRFKQGNILLGALSPHPGYYDVVFCRNLLIYFDRETQKTAVDKLYRTLKKDAILFVGHAECSQISDTHFQRSPYPNSFSFIKREKPIEKEIAPIFKSNAEKTTVPPPEKNAIKKVLNKKTTVASGPTINPKSTTATQSARKTPNQKPLIDSLRPAEKLVNEARYAEAESLCSAFLEVHPDSSHGHYMLGLIKKYQGDQKMAESLLKKAIYLDPNHEPALLLSCALAEQNGDIESVRAFKRRIQRVRNRKGQDEV